jgi:hypothetical protein
MEYTIKHNNLIGVTLKRQGFKNLRQYSLPTIFWINKEEKDNWISITQRGSCNGQCGDDWRLFTSFIEHKGINYKVDLDNIESSIASIVNTIKGLN